MPVKNANHDERLKALRMQLRKRNYDGMIIPRTDEYQGEFIAPYAEIIAWLSGFTGSAALAVIMPEKAVMMSDGRYTIQLRDQVDETLYELQDSTKNTAGEWIAQYLKKHSGRLLNIAYNPWLHTPVQIESIHKKLGIHNMGEHVNLVALEDDIFNAIWHDRPSKPANPVTIFPAAIAEKTAEEKRQMLAKQLRVKGADACILTQGDSICWLLNIRGNDVPFSPLPLSYAVLYANGKMDWFITPAALSDDVIKHIGDGVAIYPPKQMRSTMRNINGTIWLDRTSAPLWFEMLAKTNSNLILDAPDPCSAPKACKTASEQGAIRDAHIRDACAMIKFMKWFAGNAEKGALDELKVEERLENFRREDDAYIGPSFSTIAGYNENGAIVHYRATEKTNKRISGDGLLLLDSGGQYRWGTTDITRTLPVGNVSAAMREYYTLVLKGHIALASAIFDRDTKTKEIDTLARAPLQERGADYAHGTGHGVGCNLCVHEAASNISPRGDKPFEQGMLLSNEPGYYEEGAFGIRLENLVLVQPDDSGRFCFETVTLVPFEGTLIDMALLNDQDISWLKAYYEKIREKIAPHLDPDTRQWLLDKINIF